MLYNGTAVNNDGDVLIGSSQMACHLCAMKYRKEHPDQPISVCYDAVRGKMTGKKIKVFPTLRDPNSEKVYICEDCLKAAVESLEK